MMTGPDAASSVMLLLRTGIQDEDGTRYFKPRDKNVC